MFKSDISTWICGIIIALIVIGLIMVLMGKGSTRESFVSKSLPKSSGSGASPTCGDGEYSYCTIKAGSNVACGCLKSEGGYKEEFDRTNAIACGDNGAYVCNYVKRPDGNVKIACGCLEMMDKSSPMVILPERFLN